MIRASLAFYDSVVEPLPFLETL